MRLPDFRRAKPISPQPQHTPAALAEQLQLLQPNDRAWFWLCADPTLPVPLLLQPLYLDPDASTLRASALELSPGRPASVGLASVDGLGLMSLCGRRLSRTMLRHLAAWVVAHTASHPMLARLKDVTLIRTGADNLVLARLSDPSLWSSLPPARPGIDDQTRSDLAGLEVGQRHWFWLTAPDVSDPVLLLGTVEDDPDGAELAASAQDLQRPGVWGQLERAPSGRLVLSSDHPIDTLSSALGPLQQRNIMGSALLLETRDGTITETRWMRTP
jgi:hypothetical protein